MTQESPAPAFELVDAAHELQWRGVGDDDHADDWLLREPVDGLTIMFEIVKCAMEIDAVPLQKGRRLHPGLVAH